MRGYTELLRISALLLHIGLCNSAGGPKIAIIGGGIGGASASHYLNELFNGELSIDLFEAGKLGGRLATMEVAGMKFEAGGSLIHERNLIMKHFVKLLGIEERGNCGDEKIGIWNKEKFVFKESSYEFMTLAKLIYRYGLQPFRLHGYVSTLLDDFAKIYKLHDNGIAFTNVTGLLSAMNTEFPQLLKISMKEHLTNLGYSSQLINELVEAALVANYGQNTDIQSFVSLVAMAGSGSSIWSVKDGNKNVPEHLIYRNPRVKVVPSIVKEIVHLQGNSESSQYELRYSNNGSSDRMKSIYDIVIVAAPLTKDQAMPIEFKDFPETVQFQFPGAYQSIFVTFVHGYLNAKYFNLDEPIDAILSCDPKKTIINSVGNLVSVEGNCSKVWKIFSGDLLEQRLIDDMFTQGDHIERIKWKAFPKYSTAKPRLDFKLHDSLYHVNAIEWAGSAMEMSAVGGRNVAILAYNEYNEKNTVKDSSNGGSNSKRDRSSCSGDL